MARSQVPQAAYTIGPLDVLQVAFWGTLLDQPIDGFFWSNRRGRPLGPAYGRVHVGGLSLEAAEKAIQKKLEPILKKPDVQVTLPSDEADSPAVHWQDDPLPKAPYTIKPGDLLFIAAIGLLPDQPIRGVYLVEPTGTVPLGPAYGRAKSKT